MAVPLIRALILAFAIVFAAYASTARAWIVIVAPIVGLLLWSCGSRGTANGRRDFRECGLCCLVPYFTLLGLLYAWVGSAASQEPWGFRIADSPVNRSSCSRTENQNALVYHPLGYVEWSPEVYATLVDENGKFVAQSFCALPAGSRWADATEVPPNSYMANVFGEPDLSRPCDPIDPACDRVATNRPEDYPDLGRGLRLGKFPGSLTTDTALCRGVVPLANDLGISGRGLEICAQCMNPRPSHCAEYDGDFFCFLCPGGYFVGEPVPSVDVLRTTAMLCIFMSVLVAITTCYAYPPILHFKSGLTPLY